jgi:hypothetical protein
MKTNAIALFVVLVGLATGVAPAQFAEPLNFRAPFAFVVGDSVLPAEEYTIRVVSLPGKLFFHSADGTVNIFINSVPLQKASINDRFRVVFHRYGTHYYLSEIWTPGYHTGRMVMQTPAEVDLAKNMTQQHVILYADARNF